MVRNSKCGPGGIPWVSQSASSLVDTTALTLSCEASPGNGCLAGVWCCMARLRTKWSRGSPSHGSSRRPASLVPDSCYRYCVSPVNTYNFGRFVFCAPPIRACSGTKRLWDVSRTPLISRVSEHGAPQDERNDVKWRKIAWLMVLFRFTV